MKTHNFLMVGLILILCACSGSVATTPSIKLTTSPVISIPGSTPSHSPLDDASPTLTLSPQVLTTSSTLTPTKTNPKPTATNTVPPMPLLNRNLQLESPFLWGDDVVQLQVWLLGLGYASIGNADGVFGELTDGAVRQFQEDFDLMVDGIVGQLTWAALYQAAYDLPDPTPTGMPPTPGPVFEALMKGDSGTRVKDIQSKLISLGYPICEQLGVYDLQTEAAVRLFQVENGLTADGTVNSLTWSALTNVSAKKYQQPDVPVYSVSGQYLLEKGAWALAMDKNDLWFFSNEQVVQFDPTSMQPIKALPLPSLGQQMGSDGMQYDVMFAPWYIFPPKTGEQIWLMGGYGFGDGPGRDAVLSIDSSGNLMIPPYLFPGDYSYGMVLDALYVDNEIWAFQHIYGEVSMHLVDYTGGLIPSVFMGSAFADTSAYAWDGGRLWALIATEGYALAPVDAYGATYGKGIGPCGSDLTWDGTWFWVLRDDRLYAYNSAGQLKAIATPPDGYEIREFVANDNYIAASASGNGKKFILIFNK